MVADIHPARRDAEIIRQIRCVILVRRFRMQHVCSEPVYIRRRQIGLGENFLEYLRREFVRRSAGAAFDPGFAIGDDANIAPSQKLPVFAIPLPLVPSIEQSCC